MIGGKMEFSVLKKMDNLGRIVIPAVFREKYGIEYNESVELVPTEQGILIKAAKKEEHLKKLRRKTDRSGASLCCVFEKTKKRGRNVF